MQILQTFLYSISKGRLKIFVPKKKLCRFVKFFFILLILLLPVVISYLFTIYFSALNTQSTTPILGGLDFVRYLDVEVHGIDSSRQNGTRCESQCFYWNPSIIHFRGKTWFAVREATLGLCNGGLSEVLASQITSRFRKSLNSIVVGELNSFEPSKEVTIWPHIRTIYDIINQPVPTTHHIHDKAIPAIAQYIVPTDQPFDEPANYGGFEDPRLLTHVNKFQYSLTGSKESIHYKEDLYIIATSIRNMMVHPFLLKITDNVSPDHFQDPKPFGFPTEMTLWFEGSNFQKNWMYIPTLIKLSLNLPLDFTLPLPRKGIQAHISGGGMGCLLFLQQIYPLRIVRVDPVDAFAEMYYDNEVPLPKKKNGKPLLPKLPIFEPDKTKRLMKKMRGSTGFIRIHQPQIERVLSTVQFLKECGIKKRHCLRHETFSIQDSNPIVQIGESFLAVAHVTDSIISDGPFSVRKYKSVFIQLQRTTFFQPDSSFKSESIPFPFASSSSSKFSSEWSLISEYWRISHISDEWVLPSEISKLPHRIQFPMSIIEDLPKLGEDPSFLISFGDMDCSSHVAKVSKAFVMDMLKPVIE